MARGRKVGSKKNSKKRISSKNRGSDESDEDYVVSDEENVVSDEDYCSSLDEYASEEDFDSFVDEEEEEFKKVRKVVTSKAKKRSSVPHNKVENTTLRKRRRVYCEEDEDEDYNENDDEEAEDDEVELEDDGEDDYEKFTLNEEELSDEEKKSTMRRKKSNKLGKNGIKRQNGATRTHKRRKRANVSNKTSRKKRRTNSGLRRKIRSSNNGDLIDCGSVLRLKPKKRPRQRKRRYVAVSDSDFPSSGSSDYEYTISEEEREQVREAKKLCGTLKTSSRTSSFPNKIQENGDINQERKPPIRKGKEKVEEVKAIILKQICGICLSEEDHRRVRGTLNCCTHYFCFACIMEWAKVESRCPLCKQRFKTINKPARSTLGVDLREVVITVPERDQVYQPSEEELRSYLDPYENVICTECHEGGDDGLMLLCDICDSPAHTYCVGLGREVPEGNWYCDGCRPVALGSNSRAQGHFSNLRSTANSLSNGSSTVVNDGERLGLDLNSISSPRTPFIQGFGNHLSPRFPTGGLDSPVSGAAGPTLTGRRLLHRHIQQMFSSNRSATMNGRTDGIQGDSLSTGLLNSQIDRVTESIINVARAEEMGTPCLPLFEETLPENPSPAVQYGGLFSSGSSHLRRQAIQNPPPSTITDRPLNGTMLSPLRRHAVENQTTAIDRQVTGDLWPELAGVNSGSSYGQFNQCSSRLNMWSDNGLSLQMISDNQVAKEQLQSMIHIHLKNLSPNIHLGTVSFQDIARSATHTILAACGLEHRSSEVCCVPPPSTCSHIELMTCERTSLIKGCCSSCFDSFVGNVVKKIFDTTLPRWLNLGL